ncbi:hypothetical protein M5689_022652 [Euphorbia peplus]|nr:hypothetical protein M5689_022652 [Euphorbia peplus]
MEYSALQVSQGFNTLDFWGHSLDLAISILGLIISGHDEHCNVFTVQYWARRWLAGLWFRKGRVTVTEQMVIT